VQPHEYLIPSPQQVHSDTWACGQLQFPLSIPLFEARIPLVQSQCNLQAGVLGWSQGGALQMHPFSHQWCIVEVSFHQ